MAFNKMILINLFYQFIELHASSLKFGKQFVNMCILEI